MKPDLELLMAEAERARRRAHAPYSRFAVGAALLADDGRIFTGANVENASYGLTVCAERVALWKGVSEGARSFAALAVAGPARRSAPPCGACRQVLAEFAPELRVFWRNASGRRISRSLDQLLPLAFRLTRPRAR
jgi:cytidine deaminase